METLPLSSYLKLLISRTVPLLLEDGIPTVDTVKRLVELVLLELAILPVLFCNLVLVPTCTFRIPVSRSVWLPAVLVAVVLHNCIVLEIVNFGFDTVTVGDVAVHVLDQLDLFGIKVETAVPRPGHLFCPTRAAAGTGSHDGNTRERYGFPGCP